MKDSMRNILSFHQKSKYQEDSDDIPLKKKKKVTTFPHWTVYIAWTCKWSCVESWCIIWQISLLLIYDLQSKDWINTYYMVSAF